MRLHPARDVIDLPPRGIEAALRRQPLRSGLDRRHPKPVWIKGRPYRLGQAKPRQGSGTFTAANQHAAGLADVWRLQS